MLNKSRWSFDLGRTKKGQNNARDSLPPRVFSLVEDLPSEILAAIFTIACHDTLYGFREDKHRQKRTTPFILGHVCTEWRAIVRSTPEIWSHVPLHLKDSKEDMQVSLLQEWIGHSGECPLSISLVLENEDIWSERLPRELLQTLAACAHRWEYIDWTLPESWYIIFDGIRDNLFLLHTLSANVVFAYDASINHQLNIFSTAPVLRDVRLLNGYWLADVNLPWDQLYQLTIHKVYVDECLTALHKTSNIKFLSLQYVLEAFEKFDDIHVELSNLKILIISESRWQDVAKLLRQCSAPLLHRLEISAPLDNALHDAMVLELPLVLTGLNSHLTALCLTGFIADKERLPVLFQPDGEQEAPLPLYSKERASDIVKLLHGIPSLRDLELHLEKPSLPNSDLIVNLLKPHFPSTGMQGESEKNTLPNLERFVFSGPLFFKDGFDTALYEALRARRRQGSAATEKDIPPLHDFELKSEYPQGYSYIDLPSEYRKNYQSLVDTGMRLHIVFSDKVWV